MSLNSLKIASDGYLKRTSKAVLTIAVAGYLNYNVPTPVIPSVPVTEDRRGGGIVHKDDRRLEERKEILRRIAIDDSDTIAIVQLCLQITTI